jgi:DNA-binding MarR family transcriptional regulator
MVDRELAEALVRLSHLVQCVFTDVSRDHDLTPQQTQLLCVLTRGPVGMKELGRSLHLEKSSLTGLVDRVERRGLVTRVRDPYDGRAFHVALTRQGTRLAVEAHADICVRLGKFATDLDLADRQLLTSVIMRIVG